MLNAVQTAVERIDRLEAALVEIVPDETMAPVVAAFQAMRGVRFITAVTLVVEAGDLRRLSIRGSCWPSLAWCPQNVRQGRPNDKVGSLRQATAAPAKR
jgi:transposase